MNALRKLALIVPLALATSAAYAAHDKPAGHGPELARLYEQYWEENLKLNPLQATQIGDPRYNAELPNSLAPDYRAKLKAFHKRYLDAATKLGPDGLGAEERLSYDVFTYDRKMDLEGFRFPQDLIPVNQFYNLANQLAQFGSGSNAQPFKTVADYDAWLARAKRVPALFDQSIANMRDGVKAGVVQPKVLMQKVIPQLQQQIVAKPEDSVFWGPIKAMPKDFDDADKARLEKAYRELITATLVPSFRKLEDYIANEYLPKCRDTVGLGAQPDGKAWYDYQVRRNTTTDLSAAEIHQIGLDEVERIHGEMEKVMAEVGFKGTLQEFFKHVKEDPAQIFASEEDLLAAYRGVRAKVEPALPRLFAIKPKADFEIRPVEPYRAQSASGGQYNGPSMDGSRPGIFYVNTYDLKSRPKFGMETLFLHEAIPGHHFQIALQRELTGIPTFRRFSGQTAFNEGWGLYAESLGKELGMYSDPYQYFGNLEGELWRSIRLVTDTGLHAQGWTRQQVLDYMFANSSVEQTTAIAEAERFMAIPGQALAYKMGQRKIRELRTRAEAALGERFDVRLFHTEVLKDGSLPLGILERKIDRWIESQKAATKAS